MPTYAYACSHCAHRFDIYQTFTDDALTTCPECGQQSLRKVFASVGVVFKGSGFYRTDSRAAETASTPASKEKKSESKDSSSKESAPAKPAEKSSGSAAPAKAAASS